MDPIKVAGVAEWPEPSNKREVQSFLGFVNFYLQRAEVEWRSRKLAGAGGRGTEEDWSVPLHYQRFIKGFSHHARPLFDLTHKEQKWNWDSSAASAFRKLKELVTSAPVLVIPADDQPFQIEADSSDFATGAVLSQLCVEDGKWHPVAFLSKSLSDTEWNYEIHDKEMLAIMRALDEWRHFLEGAPHKVEI